MSYSDYWDGDPIIAKYYREKFRCDIDRKNTEMWIQGMYVYDAILRCSPVLNALSKNHEPVEYMGEPIPLNKNESKEKENRMNEKRLQAGKNRMMAWMETVNAKMMKEKEQTNG